MKGINVTNDIKLHRCEETIVQCFAHFNEVRDCCKYTTGPKPFYSNMGTCFTLDVDLAEVTAHSSSNVRINLLQDSLDMPEYQIAYKACSTVQARSSMVYKL